MTAKPFRPSNGTHFELFYHAYCGRCRLDQAYRDNPEAGDGCQIVAFALAFNIDHPKYPKEWVIDEGADPGLIGGAGARCTAFQDELKEPPAYRCPLTPDLFS